MQSSSYREKMGRSSMRWTKLMEVLDHFFLAPASPRPLAALRIGLALVLLLQAYYLRSSVLNFFAHDGIIQGELNQYLSDPHTPQISWVVEKLSSLGVSESSCIFAICGAYVFSLILLGLGLWTRLLALSTWFLHWLFMSSGCTTTYGVDLYAHVFLFYLIWMPAGGMYSLDAVLYPKKRILESSSARLGLRVLQLQLCITYLCSGIEKAKGMQWWNGELIWRALDLPVYRQFDMTWLARYPLLPKIGGWVTLFLEIGYCVFIWPRRTRRFWVLAITGLHLGIAIFLGLELFGIIMCVLTLTIFGFSAEADPVNSFSPEKRSWPRWRPYGHRSSCGMPDAH